MLRTPRHWERNALFDFPDHRLARANKMLRLRVACGESTLTWKERPRELAGHKSRDEIETRVEAASALRCVFEKLGMTAVAHYTKRRTEYSAAGGPRRGRSRVLAFDETSAGNFIELEGPRSWINRTAKQLGYSREDYITSSYLHLLSNVRRARLNSRLKRRADAPSRLIS